MERQLQQFELNVRDWQNMTKRCALEDKKVLDAVDALVRTLQRTPQWVSDRCFDPPLKQAIRDLPQVKRTCSCMRVVTSLARGCFVVLQHVC